MKVRLGCTKFGILYVCQQCGADMYQDKGKVTHPTKEPGILFRANFTCLLAGKSFNAPSFELEELE